MLYDNLLEQNVCEHLTGQNGATSVYLMTEWYWSGSLDAFADMCNLRCKPDTQAETREVADQISDKMKELFPVSWEALTDG